MFEPKIRIERELYERLKADFAKKGYASVDEFVAHVLGDAVAASEPSESEEAVKKRLQGLGYIE